MSWVAPLNATTASKAIQTAKNEGRCRARATKPNPMPETSCVTTTKNFFVLNISKKGLHRNFNVHGNMITEVHKAILLSSIPSPLNISTQTMFRTTNGNPMAKYALGTQRSGEISLLSISVITHS